MTDFLSNLLDNRAEAFDAKVQYVIGNDRYTLKSIQRVPSPMFKWLDEERYSDDGILYLVGRGQGHSYEFNIALTADLADPNSTPTDTKTLSYVIAQKEARNRVQAVIRQVFLTKAISQPNAIFLFTVDVQEIDIVRNVGGAIEAVNRGRILSNTTGTPISFLRS